MEKTGGFQKILRKWLAAPFFSAGRLCSVDESVVPLLLLALHCSGGGKSLLVEIPSGTPAEKIRGELRQWAAVLDLAPSVLALPEGVSSGKRLPEAEIPRAAALDRVLSEPPDILLVSAAAELSPAPDPECMKQSGLLLRPGLEIAPGRLCAKLAELDYDDEPEVVQKGEFARRAGLVDVFSPAAAAPARIEFFGNTIESIRLFSTASQISSRETTEYKLILRSGAGSSATPGKDADFTSYIRLYRPWIVTLFPAACAASLERFGSADLTARWKKLHESDPRWRAAFQLLDEAESAAVPEDGKVMSPVFPFARHILRLESERAEENLPGLVRRLSAALIRQFAAEGWRIFAAAGTDGGLTSLRQWLKEEQLDTLPKVKCIALTVPRGIFLPREKVAVFSEYELYSSPRRLAEGKRIVSAEPEIPGEGEDASRDAVGESLSSDLEEGDYAVHLNYGIGICRGLVAVTGRHRVGEALKLEFADEKFVYVPVHQAYCVSRYIGARKGAVQLSKLGGVRWSKLKSAAAAAVRTLALDLLRLHAVRCRIAGAAFPKDTLAQQLFEKSFSFTETPDQLRAAAEIKHDMESPRPMDRLLCGDVGYGKTEVAMRAVFKCVQSGRQAAVLVPTTVLAQQHYYTFLERFAEYPIIIESLSRFRTQAEQQEIIRRLRSGRIDIVIGTHRLLQKDVAFRNLGLVVVDEEQRFGVSHKEQLKTLRATVDVLTMTATPIPRTLYFSLSGLRDLSTLLSAPIRRLPIQTVVSQDDDALVISAVVRELQRGGQVYYLHNRVQTIGKAADRLRAMFPQARIAVAHGRMAEHDLEEVMSTFIAGGADILVCTTIIESGLDIPNVNTILIERADRFGLAELYQLRGRVGRWRRQAYAYLLLPKHGILSGNVRQRIAAMRRYTHLGAGFQLALRDLEIRGAGNILGAEQSGHVNAIGFSLYCDLLRAVTSKLKGEESAVKCECAVTLDFVDYAWRAPADKAAAAFPPEYINSDRLRLDAYRRLALLTDLKQLAAFRQEIRDRFGALPREVENLLACARIRIVGGCAHIHSVTGSGGRLLMERGGAFVRVAGQIPVIPDAASPDAKLQSLAAMMENFFLKNMI